MFTNRELPNLEQGNSAFEQRYENAQQGGRWLGEDEGPLALNGRLKKIAGGWKLLLRLAHLLTFAWSALGPTDFARSRSGQATAQTQAHLGEHLTTCQYEHLVDEWLGMIGLDTSACGTHSMRRTKLALIYKRTGNLRACQLLLCHSKLESTVRHLGIEVDDALVLSGRPTFKFEPAAASSPPQPYDLPRDSFG